MSFFLIRSTRSASRAARREALRTSGHTELVPEDARRIEGILTATSPFGTALPTSDLHPVSVEYMCILACIFLLTIASHTVYSLPESSIAPYLGELQERVKKEGVRVGSYPFFMKGVFVSLIGRNEVRVRELGKEVERQTQGRAVTEQEVIEKKEAAMNL
jgi:hypothetical protein